jgi:C-terminal processing protease CtpA/Prc
MLKQILVTCVVATGTIFPGAGAGAAQTARADSIPAAAYLEDFDFAWTFVRDTYAYFDRKQTDWELVRALYRERAVEVRSGRELVALLEEVMEELYDPHAHLGVNTASSPRLVPSGTGLWAEWRNGRAILTEVRAGSEAERTGLRPGMEVVSIRGTSVREVVRDRLPRSLRASDPAAEDWALRAALAGRHDAAVRIAVRARNGEETFEFRPGPADRPAVPITAKVLEEDIGYVRIHDALGDTALIPAWDAAVAELRGTRALVIDLRDTPGGGNTTVARAILGRLVTEERPYQRHELPAEERRHGVRRIWVEHVAPRGPFQYDRPVAVLVGRWTGSMGEGIAIGLDGMKRATIIGTPMAGLLGATYGARLPHTGYEVRVPAERLHHVNGTPRESWVPTVSAPAEGPGTDTALLAALQLLRR